MSRFFIVLALALVPAAAQADFSKLAPQTLQASLRASSMSPRRAANDQVTRLLIGRRDPLGQRNSEISRKVHSALSGVKLHLTFPNAHPSTSKVSSISEKKAAVRVSFKDGTQLKIVEKARNKDGSRKVKMTLSGRDLARSRFSKGDRKIVRVEIEAKTLADGSGLQVTKQRITERNAQSNQTTKRAESL